MERKCKPLIERRETEANQLITESVRLLEEKDEQMNLCCKNLVNFFKRLATKFDDNRDKLKKTDFDFNVKLA
jgi:hypothetical protein